MERGKDKKYTAELKEKAVQEYQNGGGSRGKYAVKME